MNKHTWKDVDWVELGTRSWEIDETGAWCADPPENLVTRRNPYHTAVGERAHAHLDFKTLDLILSGPPEWVRRVFFDLRAAGVPGYEQRTCWTAGSATTSGVTFGTGSATIQCFDLHNNRIDGTTEIQ